MMGFYRILAVGIFIPVLSIAQVPKNVLIFSPEEGQYAPCEPSIAINQNNPKEIVAGAVLKYVFVSTDSGVSWNQKIMESDLGVYGDPCIVSGDSGSFFYFHLSNPSGEGWSNPDILDRIVCQKLGDIQGEWTDGASIGMNHPKDQDKEWAVWDPFGKRLITTWTQFDLYGSDEPSCESNILMSVSEDGDEWSDPITISSIPGNCKDESETAEGAVPTIGDGGEVYVAWALNGNIYFQAFDSDLKPRSKRPSVAVEGGANWAFSVPGLGRANGMPITATDLSGGPYHGSVYINWADQRNGEDDTDVWLVRSTMGGESWSEPIRVNNDPAGKHQFFTWLTVDQSTGYLYVVFYDRRNHDDHATDVYLAVSRDGGQTFENRKISESPFYPPKKAFFGDYNNISAVDGVIRPIWSRNDDEVLSIWTALINENK